METKSKVKFVTTSKFAAGAPGVKALLVKYGVMKEEDNIYHVEPRDISKVLDPDKTLISFYETSVQPLFMASTSAVASMDKEIIIVSNPIDAELCSGKPQEFYDLTVVEDHLLRIDEIQASSRTIHNRTKVQHIPS